MFGCSTPYGVWRDAFQAPWRRRWGRDPAGGDPLAHFSRPQPQTGEADRGPIFVANIGFRTLVERIFLYWAWFDGAIYTAPAYRVRDRRCTGHGAGNAGSGPRQAGKITLPPDRRPFEGDLHDPGRPGPSGSSERRSGRFHYQTAAVGDRRDPAGRRSDGDHHW